MPNDFDFKVGFDASDVVSGSAKVEQSTGGMEAQFEKLIAVAERIAASVGGGLSHLGDGAKEAGQKISDGVGHGLNDVQHKFDETKSHGEGFLGSLQEKFGELGGLLVGGGLFAGGVQGIEQIFSAGEKRIKSLEDYRIALLQSGVEEKNLGAAQEAGGKIVDALSEKYAKNKEDIRGVLTEVSGLGGISVEQSSKVAEIGLAFEQVGVPARSFKQLLAGAGGPESLAALESIRTKFPAIATAMEGAGTAGEKVDAIFKGITPTLAGMKDAADGPLGAIDKLKNIGIESLGKLGETLITVVEPISKVLIPVLTIASNEIGTIATGIEEALKPIGEIFAEAGGTAGGFEDVLKGVEQIMTGGLKVSIFVIGETIKGVVDIFREASQSISEIGNLFKGASGEIDTANIEAGNSVRLVKAAYDEYGKSVEEVNKQISSADGVAKQVAELDSLLQKTSLTDEETKRMSDLQAKLGEQFPIATSGVNAQTGALTVNIAKVKELSAEQKALADASFKENINKNILGPMADLVPAINAQKAKLQDLRATLDKANASGDAQKIIETRDAYLKQQEALKGSEEQLKKNVTVLVQQGLVGNGTAEEMAAKFHTTKENMASIVPIVADINKGLAEEKKAGEEAALSIAGQAKEFDAAKQAADAAKTAAVSALADNSKKQRELNEDIKTGKITAEDADKKQTELTKQRIDDIDKGKVAVQGSIILAKDQKDAAITLGAETNKVTKNAIDYLGLLESQLKLEVDKQKLTFLEQDNGKLSLEHQIDILKTEAAGQPVIEAQLQKEIAKLANLKQTVENKKKLADAQIKENEFEQKILETTAKIRDEEEKLSLAAIRIATSTEAAAINYLKMLDATNQLTGDKTGLGILSAEADLASQQYQNLLIQFSKKPEAAGLVDLINKFHDVNGILKEGLNGGDFAKQASALAQSLKDVFASKGIDPTPLLNALTDVGNKGLAITKDNLTKAIDVEKLQTAKIKNEFDARVFLIGESGISEVDQIRLRIAAEEDEYAKLKQAAIDAHDFKELDKLTAAHSATELKNNEDLFKAEKKQYNEYVKNIKETVGAGFSAAFTVANKALFDPLDKSLEASTNIFGAFASGVIHHLIDIGEQALANLAEGAIAAAIAGSLTTASMAAIEAAAAPAAFAVAVATFGTAAGTALGALGISYAAFQGLLSVPKLDQGTVVNSPTLAMIGETFQEELVLPMKTAKEFLAEAAGGIGGNGLTKSDIREAFGEALQANPFRGQITGHDINLVNAAEDQRLVRRGA